MSETAVFRPNKTSLAIMQLVNGYFSKTRKGHTLMDQKWILKHLAAWHGVEIARSTLCYNLKILREEGLIETVKRHGRDLKTGEFVCRVTLYKSTAKMKRFFSRLASYFKRCAWVPSFRALKAGYVPVVGKTTSKEEVFREYKRLDSLGVGQH